MCNCIKEAEINLAKDIGEINGKKILSASMMNVNFPISNLKLVGRITTQPIKFTLEGRKTPFETSLSHTYCPWCGEKYSEFSESKSEPDETSKV